MSRPTNVALDFSLIQKLLLRRVVAAEHQAVVPAGEVPDDFQVGRARTDARCVLGGESLGEFPEHPVHGHKIIRLTLGTHVADAGPFCVPAVGAIVAVAGFGKTVKTPSFIVVSNSQQY